MSQRKQLPVSKKSLKNLCGSCFTVCAFSEKPFGMVLEIRLCIFFKEVYSMKQIIIISELQFWVRSLV